MIKKRYESPQAYLNDFMVDVILSSDTDGTTSYGSFDQEWLPKS